MCFEDFFKVYIFKTGSRKLLKEEIISFASDRDNQVFHLNEDLARQSKFKGLIASGWETLLVAFKLILNTKKIEKSSLGSPGLEEVNWLVPVRPNDILSCKVTVMSARLSKKKDYGIVRILIEIFNQEKKLWLI